MEAYEIIRKRFTAWKRKTAGEYTRYGIEFDDLIQILDIGLWQGYSLARKRKLKKYIPFILQSARWYLLNAVRSEIRHRRRTIYTDKDNINVSVGYENKFIFWLDVNRLKKSLPTRCSRILQAIINGYKKPEIAKQENISRAAVYQNLDIHIRPAFKRYGLN